MCEQRQSQTHWPCLIMGFKIYFKFDRIDIFISKVIFTRLNPGWIWIDSWTEMTRKLKFTGPIFVGYRKLRLRRLLSVGYVFASLVSRSETSTDQQNCQILVFLHLPLVHVHFALTENIVGYYFTVVSLHKRQSLKCTSNSLVKRKEIPFQTVKFKDE